MVVVGGKETNWPEKSSRASIKTTGNPDFTLTPTSHSSSHWFPYLSHAPLADRRTSASSSVRAPSSNAIPQFYPVGHGNLFKALLVSWTTIYRKQLCRVCRVSTVISGRSSSVSSGALIRRGYRCAGSSRIARHCKLLLQASSLWISFLPVCCDSKLGHMEYPMTGPGQYSTCSI